jgi:hypothetical protein
LEEGGQIASCCAWNVEQAGEVGKTGFDAPAPVLSAVTASLNV